MNKEEPTFDERLMSLNDRLLYFALGLTRNMDDAKDLIQESMLKALMNKDQYTTGTNIKAWMFTIVRNTFINGAQTFKEEWQSGGKKIETTFVNGYSTLRTNAFYNELQRLQIP